MQSTFSRRGPGRPTVLRRFAPVALLAGGLLAGIVGLTAAAAEPSPELTTITVTRQVLYMGGDGELLVEEQQEQRIIEEFKVNPKVWAQGALPLQFRYNPEGAPIGHDVPALIANAVNTWNAVTSTFSFAYAGETADGSNLCDTGADFDPSEDLDGKNTIQFVPLDNQLALGITCSWTLNSPNIVEFDMRLNPSAAIWFSGSQTVAGKYDMASTMLHELGHAAGLGHSDVAGSVMQPSLSAGIMKRTLTADDTAGLTAAYPGGTTATPTPTTPTQTATPPPITTVPIPPGQFKLRLLQIGRD